MYCVVERVLKMRRVVGLIPDGGPIELFIGPLNCVSILPVLHDWCNKPVACV